MPLITPSSPDPVKDKITVLNDLRQDTLFCNRFEKKCVPCSRRAMITPSRLDQIKGNNTPSPWIQLRYGAIRFLSKEYIL